MSDPKSYTIGWICALTTEYVAAQCFLDERHPDPNPELFHNAKANKNDYTLGRIGSHNVVISVLPLGDQGAAAAAVVAEGLCRCFPNVRFGVIVGVGGGVSGVSWGLNTSSGAGAGAGGKDVRLGDVVVSIPLNGRSGVIQYEYEFGEDDARTEKENVKVKAVGFLDQPPHVLRSAVSGLDTQYEMDGHSLKENVDEVLAKRPRLKKKYKRPDQSSDRLYKNDFVHSKDCPSTANAENCLLRNPRLEDEDDPVIHYGSIASSNQVMNNALIRDKLGQEKDILCFETEAAGLMNNFPCLVIRGICDYADSHYEEYVEWRGYAAMIAAAYAKDLLNRISPQHVEMEKTILEVLKISLESVQHIAETTDHVAELTERIDRSLALDKLPTASGAEYASYAEQYEPECLEGTRTDLLQQIAEWASSVEGRGLFWLNGMAGTGKSTISRTVARSQTAKGNLGASFFFKRGEEDRGNAKMLFPTLVQQLVIQCPALIPGVRKAVEAEPNIASKSLGEQFSQLFLQPLLDLDASGQQPRKENIVIVLDALDECDHDRDVRTIIRLLAQLQRARSIRIRTFLTSRPELPVRLGFKNITNQDYQDLVLHEIPEEVTRHDISLFLHDRFTNIRIERDVPYNWPSERTIRDLIDMSVPLFISAATVCRYIEHSQMEPTTRLRELLQDQTRYATKMEKTYMPILTRLVNDIESEESEQEQLLANFQNIIGVIVLLAVPLSITSLSKLLNIETQLLRVHLDSFQSVLSVPKNTPTEQEKPVRILHLSFRDFLVSSSESKFRVDERVKHKEIAGFCFKIMKLHLKKNMCKLNSPAAERSGIDPQAIRHLFPSEFGYACRYWVNHFENGEISSAEVGDLMVFLKEHFLHWVEAMSLLGLISEVVGVIHRLQVAFSNREFPETKAFLHDANRFVLRVRQIIDEAPLQLYSSALIFAPQMSIVRREFENQIPPWICQLPQVERGWSAELQTLTGHSSGVSSVAFSPDGRFLASGSSDQTVRLWDTTTGELQETTKGPKSTQAVAFSPDGRLLVSAHSEYAVKNSWIHLMDPVTGEVEQVIQTPGRINTVAVSYDSRLLATGSREAKVQLWDLETGELRREYSGIGSVSDVAFSPNGEIMAFMTDDGGTRAEVQIWNLTTGVLSQTVEKSTHKGIALAFSPDSQQLAFGVDHDIHLWDLRREELDKILPGPKGDVTSLTFSSDGCLIAASHWHPQENTTQIWDRETGQLIHALSGEGIFALSVAFSPGSRLLATGYFGSIIRLWDPQTDNLQKDLEGHDGWVSSLAFSPDGKVAASGSGDCATRLWDPMTGALLKTIHHSVEWALTLAFSPDSRRIAVGDHAWGMCVLDLGTGVSLHKNSRPDPILTMAFSKDGNLLGCVRPDKENPRLMNLITGELHDFELPEEFLPVVLSPDGKLIASVDQTVREQKTNRELYLWDTESGKELESWEVEIPDELYFSHDGAYICNGVGALFDCRNYLAEGRKGEDEDVFTVVQEWLLWNGERLLWLGNQSGVKKWAVRGSLIALGHSTGRVSFLKIQRCAKVTEGKAGPVWSI